MHVAFRVDASADMGTGHIMRCLTLADALHAVGASCRFVCRRMPQSLTALIRERGHEVAMLTRNGTMVPRLDDTAHAAWLGVSQDADAAETVETLGGQRVDWLVVDHYALDRRWESVARACASRILVIDDLADRAHDGDLLLDQNLYQNMETRYAGKVPDGCHVLYGPRFALLREEFRAAVASARPRSGELRRVLLFFGGMDASNHTTVAVEALALLRVPGLQVDVVIGAEHPNRVQIEQLCAAHGFTLHVQTARMAELMAGADLAVGAGGSASWERCCVGLPGLIIATADNQRGLVRDAAIAGLVYAPAFQSFTADALARHLGALVQNPLLLQSMSLNGMKLVDGRGAQRVLRAMGASATIVRLATAADSRDVFEWRNHPQVRQVSRSKDVIDWAAHSTWFQAALADPDRLLLVGESAGAAAGVVRFDISGDSAEVSIYKVPGRSDAGIGADLLVAAEAWLAEHRPTVRWLDAEVLGDNQPSHRLFTAAGYQAAVTRYSKGLSS